MLIGEIKEIIRHPVKSFRGGKRTEDSDPALWVVWGSQSCFFGWNETRPIFDGHAASGDDWLSGGIYRARESGEVSAG